MAKARRESKAGLIITLVFFILTTLGVGVYAYTLQAEVEAKGKAAKDAAAKEKTANDERDWYKFQATLYRSYMGQLDGVDLAALQQAREAFDANQLGQKAPDKDAVTKLIKETFDKKMPWDAANKKPRGTYEDLLAAEKRRYDDLEKLNAGLDTAKKAAEQKLKVAEDALADAKNKFDQALDGVKKQSDLDLSSLIKTNDDLGKSLTKANTDKVEEVKKVAENLRKATATIAKKDEEITTLKAVVKQKTDDIGALRQREGAAPKDWRTDWQIAAMDRTGKQPYINLGSADNVTPQLTFTVHGLGPDGKPLPNSKGSIEVVNVVRDHLSQARIINVKDPDRDPILKGDILFNPLWNPTLKKHVAVAGIIDLTGDGRDSLTEFIRNLEKQNVVVDAYLDPKDRKVKGGDITVQTDYLIVGEELPIGDERKLDEDTRKQFEEAIRAMKHKAVENGVQIISTRKYLELVGYRLPKGTGESASSGVYRSVLDKPEAPKPEAPKNQDKPGM
jgi:hypothetical protein